MEVGVQGILKGVYMEVVAICSEKLRTIFDYILFRTISYIISCSILCYLLLSVTCYMLLAL